MRSSEGIVGSDLPGMSVCLCGYQPLALSAHPTGLGCPRSQSRQEFDDRAAERPNVGLSKGEDWRDASLIHT